MGKRDDDAEEGAPSADDAALQLAHADANLRFGLSLLISIVLAAPVLWDAFEGRGPIDAALLHYLLCFAVARLGVGVVGHVYGGYKRGHAAAAEQAGPAPAQRTRGVPGGLSENR